jgi:hypothetical protein
VSLSARRALGIGLTAAGTFFVVPGGALAAENVMLRPVRTPVPYGGRVVLQGSVSPAAAGESVLLFSEKDGTWSRVSSATTRRNGTFSRVLTVAEPAPFVAVTRNAEGEMIASQSAFVRIRPRVVTAVHGSRMVGGDLYLDGRVLPRDAGTVTVSEAGRAIPAPVEADGHFRVRLTTTDLYRYRATARLQPADGFTAWHRIHSVQVELPALTVGAHGPAVAWLEHSLSRIGRYALPGVDDTFDAYTADAVLAFQEVHGLPRTGSVDDRFWQVLGTAGGPPAARIHSGDHIEVDKTRQVLFEVRDGEVASVVHVSTGATGNTPPGHWYVYSKGPGYNAKGMFDSLFFLRGFAIHGYYSVPSYPASHGCVRTPIWFASGFYTRWSVGASVYVFA